MAFGSPELFTYGIGLTTVAVAGTLYAFIQRSWRDRRQVFDMVDKSRAQFLASQAATAAANERTINLQLHIDDGFIVLDVPEAKRKPFLDLLRGFEDYAQLRGYDILFSIDNTAPNKIAFRYDVPESIVEIDSNKVKQDLYDYIQKVESGAQLEATDVPVIRTPEEHQLLVAKVNSRLNFLQAQYAMEHNAAEFMKRLSLRLAEGGSANVTIGSVDSNSHNITNSPGAIQGDGNTNAVTISHSFNERKEQINQLDGLIKLLRATRGTNASHKKATISNLEMVSTELKDEDHPDKSRIARWLTRAKDALGTFVLTAEGVSTVKGVYDSFNLGHLLAGIFK